MKTIIVISGKNNTGRTRSIKEACHLFSGLPKVKKISDGDIECAGDIIHAFEINKIKVGFISSGEVVDDIKKNLDLKLIKKCNIIVCASRASKKTRTVIKDHAKENKYKTCWIGKLTARDGDLCGVDDIKKYQNDCNTTLAELIVKWINQLL